MVLLVRAVVIEDDKNVLVVMGVGNYTLRGHN